MLKSFVPICRRWVLVFGSLQVLAAQTTTTWLDGTGKSNWSNSANWSSGVPGGADMAQFSAFTTRTPTIGANADVGALQFMAGTDAESFTGSKTLTLLSVGGLGIDNQTSRRQTFANRFALGADQTWQSTADAGGLTFNGNVDLAGYNLSLQLASAGASTITVAGNISGQASSLTVRGSGTTILSGNNSFTGGVTLNGGTLKIAADSALGSAPSAATPNNLVFDGGTLRTTASATLHRNRGLIFNSGGATIATDAGTTLTIAGIITGLGTLTKEGSGALRLAAANGNSFAGATVISAGSIVADADRVFNNSAALTLGTGTLLSLNDFAQTIGHLNGSGLLDFGSSGTGSLTLSSGTGTFAGSFRGSGTVIIGPGATLNLGADFNAPNVNFTLAGGSLALNGHTATFGNLILTGNSILDFGNTAASVLSVSQLTIQNPSLQLSIQNWAGLSDYFYAQNFPGAVPDVTGFAPQNQVVFSGFSGDNTIWQSYDRQVAPTPEPAAYGLIFLSASIALVLWRQRKPSARANV